MLLRNTVGEEANPVSTLRVSNLDQYVSCIVEDLSKQEKLLSDGFDDYLWLLFSGDKGGKHMKFHFEVIICEGSGCVYNVHIFAMYEGSDCHQNMARLL